MTAFLEVLSPSILGAGLSDAWLKAAGFKWHQMERQNTKHWLLWLGEAADPRGCFCDLGIEVAHGAWQGPSLPDAWFCWLRSDLSFRYHRFIHIRHLNTARELVGVIEGVTGTNFDPALCWYGSLRTSESAERCRRESERLDRKFVVSGYPHSEIEKDADRGLPLPEHMEAAVKAGKAK